MHKSHLPFKFHIFILGCQFNYYDAAKIANELVTLGGIESSISDSDLVIILACSVRQKAADRILGHIRNWRKSNAKVKIIISACILATDRPRFLKAADLIVKNDELRNETLKILKKLKIPTQKENTPLNDQLHDFQKYNDRSAYLSISSGCNNYCTYCAVPYTRGKEISFSSDQIIKEAKELATQEITHLILLGQNVNSYGLSDFTPRDLRKNRDRSGKDWTTTNPSPFVELLNAIQNIEEIEKISFLSPNPQDMSADLISWMQLSPKFSKILNLPMQSGSSKILAAMNRRYSQREYVDLVKNIRRAVPDIYLSTDIIVGFPGETQEDFNDTVEVVRQCQFKKAFISIYSPRPGTAAAKLTDSVPYPTKKSRFRLLDHIINAPKDTPKINT